jgi:tRNA (cytidine/uridine-2'-O-)-methyltransferase
MEVVLVAPEIPQNTGTIARTCAATKTPLHLIEPLGFTLDEKRIRRAGLDYWPHVDLTVHRNWEDYYSTRNDQTLWYLSKFGTRLYYEADFQPQDSLVFGNETSGLPDHILETVPREHLLAIPMSHEAVRSLNLSNAVNVVLYEARRQLRMDEPFTARNS